MAWDSGPKIFVSYRRKDTETHVQYLCEYLVKRYGPSAVFWDKTSIPGGMNYSEGAIQPAISRFVGVMVVVFGKNWIYGRTDGKQGPSKDVLDEIKLATDRNQYVDKNPETDLPKVRFVTVTFDNATIPEEDKVTQHDVLAEQEVLQSVWKQVKVIEAIPIRSGLGVMQDYDILARAIDEHLKDYEQARLTARSRAAMSLYGTVVGDYKIVALVGEGGTGTVYRAEHMTSRHMAAVKVLRPQLTTNAEIVERFKNELLVANAIPHPNVVQIMDVGTLPTGAPYLLMEYLEGTTLALRLKHVKSLPVRDAVDFASQAADALAALHSKGIIHRDLKPENIFLVPDRGYQRGERVKILDFGIAKFLSPPPSSAARTIVGTIMGTPAYMSPEQRGGQAIDHRADIYSLGAVLYEMLCGRTPFGGFKPEEFSTPSLKALVPPRSIKPSIPLDLEVLVVKALAERREDRFDSMADLAAKLAHLAAELKRLARPTTTKSRAPWLWSGLAAAAVATTAAAGILLRPGPPPPQDPGRLRPQSGQAQAIVTEQDDRSPSRHTQPEERRDLRTDGLEGQMAKAHAAEANQGRGRTDNSGIPGWPMAIKAARPSQSHTKNHPKASQLSLEETLGVNSEKGRIERVPPPVRASSLENNGARSATSVAAPDNTTAGAAAQPTPSNDLIPGTEGNWDKNY